MKEKIMGDTARYKREGKKLKLTLMTLVQKGQHK